MLEVKVVNKKEDFKYKNRNKEKERNKDIKFHNNNIKLILKKLSEKNNKIWKGLEKKNRKKC